MAFSACIRVAYRSNGVILLAELIDRVTWPDDGEDAVSRATFRTAHLIELSKKTAK